MKNLFLLAATIQVVFAQFMITTDKSLYTAGDTMKISWSTKPGSTLDLDSQDVGQVLLCTCNSTATFDCKNMQNNLKVSDKTVSIPISQIVDLGPEGQYTLQFATKNSGDPSQYALAYDTAWFQLKGMTGSGAANKDTCSGGQNVDNGLSGTSSSSVVSWTSYTLPASLLTLSGYEVPYTWQMGPTRTAPFQSTPGTKVTKKTTPTRRYPPSAWTPYKFASKNKYMPVTTKTPGPVSQAYNSVNFAKSLDTIPSGRKPTRIQPIYSPPPAVSSKGNNGPSGSLGQNRKRRWSS